MIHDPETCMDAVSNIKQTTIPSASFKNTEVNPAWPKGCYAFEDSNGPDGRVYFNEHNTGSRSNNARNICQGHGKKKPKTSSLIILLDI